MGDFRISETVQDMTKCSYWSLIESCKMYTNFRLVLKSTTLVDPALALIERSLWAPSHYTQVLRIPPQKKSEYGKVARTICG